MGYRTSKEEKVDTHALDDPAQRPLVLGESRCHHNLVGIPSASQKE